MKFLCIGVDEVGRGPIAGPVCVCAFSITHPSVLLHLKANSKNKKTNLPLRDSKKLTRIGREKWFEIIKVWQKEGKCNFAVSYVQADMIDKIGISPAIKKALSRSLYKLCEKTNVTNSSDSRKVLRVILDGGLKAPKEFKNQKTIIKGDEKEPAIALASIVAKVYRDKLMRRHAKRYPNYGFENHVGYGTKNHYKAIKKHGLTPLHRRSFLTRLH